jgi:hypothetical protein
MTIFELLNLVLQAGVQEEQHGKVHVTLNYDAVEVVLTTSIGPIDPRTRVVTIKTDQMIKATTANVAYHEVAHGVPQDPTSADSDLTNAVEVSRLIGRIWKHLNAA